MTMRIGGMSTGIDTETIINTLLDVERQPIKRWEASIQDSQDKIAAWSQLDQKLVDLRGTVQSLNSYVTWNQSSATSSDATVVSAKAGLSAQTGVYAVDVKTLAKAHRLASDVQVSRTESLSLEGDFMIGGRTVSVEASDNLEAIRDKINAAASEMDADKKVTASIIGKTLVLERAKTGAANIEISESGSNNVLRSLGVLTATEDPAETFQEVKNQLQAASDLSVEINGVSYTGTSNTGITDAVQGVTFNFLKEETASVSVGPDKETIKSYIEQFVEKYNDAMKLAKVQGSVNLGSSGSVDTLGILQGDILIGDLQTKMRSILGGKITDPGVADPNYNTLFSIGVWFSGQDNQLTINTEKLNDALDNHLDKVGNLFRGYETETSSGGIMRQMDAYIGRLMDPIDGRVTQKTKTYQSSISLLQKKIKEKNQQLVAQETQLWEHFASMEKAVGTINSQWQYVQSTLGLKQS